MDELKQNLQNFAEKNKIDILGFASKERFDGVDSRHNPFSIFPEGKTVIILGRRVCRGSIRSVEEGIKLNDYDKLW